jgi:hypothetical protein
MSLKCHPIRRPGHWCPPSLVQRIVSRFRGNGQTRISASSQPSSSALSCGLNRSDLDRQQSFGFAHRPHRGAGSPGSQLRAGALITPKPTVISPVTQSRHRLHGAGPPGGPNTRDQRCTQKHERGAPQRLHILGTGGSSHTVRPGSQWRLQSPTSRIRSQEAARKEDGRKGREKPRLPSDSGRAEGHRRISGFAGESHPPLACRRARNPGFPRVTEPDGAGPSLRGCPRQHGGHLAGTRSGCLIDKEFVGLRP